MTRGQQFRRINVGNAEGSSSGKLTSVMQMRCRCRAESADASASIVLSYDT